MMEEAGIHVPTYPQLAAEGKTPCTFAAGGVFLDRVIAAAVLRSQASVGPGAPAAGSGRFRVLRKLLHRKLGQIVVRGLRCRS